MRRRQKIMWIPNDGNPAKKIIMMLGAKGIDMTFYPSIIIIDLKYERRQEGVSRRLFVC